MTAAISVRGLRKSYAGKPDALKGIDLDIRPGEIFALLGPNGAGKTTLISAICGITRPTAGTVSVFGHDIVEDYRAARGCIGLVPQELATDAFETVWNVVTFTRSLFGKPHDPGYIEKLLARLSLLDKKDKQVRTLSGGMKRRLLIAKALSHEPRVLFLDEPSAGVDVELRKAMWEQVRELRETGVTIILTTHYIEEAEEMADRIGVINHGTLVLTEEKETLIRKMGKKELVVELLHPIDAVPARLASFNLGLDRDGTRLTFTYDSLEEKNGIVDLLDKLKEDGITCKDLSTRQSSLEDIFVGLVGEAA